MTTKAREQVKELLVQQWSGKPTTIVTSKISKKIGDEIIQSARDLAKGKGKPDRDNKAKTPYADRLKDFNERKAEAIELLQGLGLRPRTGP